MLCRYLFFQNPELQIALKHFLKIELDEKIMYDHFTSNLKIEDKFIEKRIQFIKQLIEQRKLKIEFQMIDTDKNLARKSINAKELKTKNEQLPGDSSFAVLIMLRIRFIKERIVQYH